MKRFEEFKNIIVNGSSRKAYNYLEEIFLYESCYEYAMSLCNVLLREVNKSLNDDIKGYFIDDDIFIKMLCGEDKISREEIIKKMCDAVKDARNTDKERLLLKAEKFICDNIKSTMLYPGAVSSYLGVSQSFLAKIFEKDKGKTLTEYIAEKRVLKSKELLWQGEKSVSEIAYMCGFGTDGAYIKAFKKVYGITPGKYKKEVLSEVKKSEV